jgi:hypothetical protein
VFADHILRIAIVCPGVDMLTASKYISVITVITP